MLVVVDGSTNPAIDKVLGAFASEPRLRVVRHERNLGIAAAYNTFVAEGRGELIAMIGDDDLCLPGRIASRRSRSSTATPTPASSTATRR